MNEVISRRKVRIVAYIRIFVSQVINSRQLVWEICREICILRHTRWSFYIHYTFPIPPIRKWAREKRLNPNIACRRKRSLYCVHCVATKSFNLFLILKQSNAGFHRRRLKDAFKSPAMDSNASAGWGSSMENHCRSLHDMKLNKQGPTNRGSCKIDLWSLYAALWDSAFVFELLLSHGSVCKDCPKLRKAISHKELIC